MLPGADLAGAISQLGRALRGGAGGLLILDCLEGSRMVLSGPALEALVPGEDSADVGQCDTCT